MQGGMAVENGAGGDGEVEMLQMTVCHVFYPAFWPSPTTFVTTPAGSSTVFR